MIELFLSDILSNDLNCYSDSMLEKELERRAKTKREEERKIAEAKIKLAKLFDEFEILSLYKTTAKVKFKHNGIEGTANIGLSTDGFFT